MPEVQRKRAGYTGTHGRNRRAGMPYVVERGRLPCGIGVRALGAQNSFHTRWQMRTSWHVGVLTCSWQTVHVLELRWRYTSQDRIDVRRYQPGNAFLWLGCAEQRTELYIRLNSQAVGCVRAVRRF